LNIDIGGPSRDINNKSETFCIKSLFRKSKQTLFIARILTGIELTIDFMCTICLGIQAGLSM